MCNTFGGVMFIAISLAVMLSMRSAVNAVPADTSAEIRAVQQRIAELQLELEQQKKQKPNFDDARLEIIFLQQSYENVKRRQQLSEQKLKAAQLSLRDIREKNKKSTVLLQNAKELLNKLSRQQKDIFEKQKDMKGSPPEMLFSTMVKKETVPYFILMNNGNGENPDDSDVIEWAKKGSAIIGNRNAVADSTHRVRVMVLEEGDSDYPDPIEVTGLYARVCPDAALRPKDNPDDVDFGFENDEMYQPVLISDGVVGFNCRVLKTAEKVEAENDDSLFEDEFSESNSVPYKVELTFHIADPEGRSYRSNTAPVMRIVRIPVHEQSLDGAATPGGDAKDEKKKERAK
jgi:hypothetical protein